MIQIVGSTSMGEHNIPSDSIKESFGGSLLDLGTYEYAQFFYDTVMVGPGGPLKEGTVLARWDSGTARWSILNGRHKARTCTDLILAEPTEVEEEVS